PVARGAVVVAEDVVDTGGAVLVAVVEGVEVACEDVVPAGADGVGADVAEPAGAGDVEGVAVAEAVLAEVLPEDLVVAVDDLAEAQGGGGRAGGGLPALVDDGVEERVPEPGGDV